jgi:exportin-T
MDQEIQQVVQAISIASDPTQIPLHQQALQFLSTVQQNANTTWRLALAIFVDVADGGARKHDSQARFYALRVLDEFLGNR